MFWYVFFSPRGFQWRFLFSEAQGRPKIMTPDPVPTCFPIFTKKQSQVALSTAANFVIIGILHIPSGVGGYDSTILCIHHQETRHGFPGRFAGWMPCKPCKRWFPQKIDLRYYPAWFLPRMLLDTPIFQIIEVLKGTKLQIQGWTTDERKNWNPQIALGMECSEQGKRHGTTAIWRLHLYVSDPFRTYIFWISQGVPTAIWCFEDASPCHQCLAAPPKKCGPCGRDDAQIDVWLAQLTASNVRFPVWSSKMNHGWF